MKEFAFILGNGISRLEVELSGLQPRGKIFGCNRLYQEFAPDILVSTDPGMATEIQTCGYSDNNTHYTRQHQILPNSKSVAIPESFSGMSSGPVALSLALQEHFPYCFLIGFDLKGVNNLINNIYAGTEHYRPKGVDNTFFGNWVNQIESLLQKHPDQRVIHVNPFDNFTPDDWSKYNNFSTMSLSSFYDMINNM
jgi:hypothetical protein